MATSSKKQASAKTDAVTSKAGDDFAKALSEFHYGDLRLSRQQVFQLQDGRNDESLLTLRYLVRVPKGTVLVQCAECGALFDNQHWLDMHGDKWHSFECSCGWSPSPGLMDKEAAMRQHSARCETERRKQQLAHREHVKQAQAMQEA